MDKKESINLKESLTWAGKLFFAGIASYLGDKSEKPQIPLKIRATEDQVKAIEEVIQACKEFQNEIDKQDSTIETVMEKLLNKNRAKENFERICGQKWPL